MKGKKKEQLYLKQDYDDYHFSLKEFLKYLKMIPVIIYPYIYVLWQTIFFIKISGYCFLCFLFLYFI